MTRVVEMELRAWTEPGPYGIGITFVRRIMYKGTTQEVNPEAVLALHHLAAATGYFVKAKVQYLDACRQSGYLLGGQVTSVKDGLVTIGDPDRVGVKLTVLPRDQFIELYEVD